MLASLVLSLKLVSLASFVMWALPRLPDRLPESLVLIGCFGAAVYLQYKYNPLHLSYSQDPRASGAMPFLA